MWHFVIGLTNFCLLQMPPRDLYMSTILSVKNGQSLDLHGVLYTPSSYFQDPNFSPETKQLDFFFFFFLNAQLVAMALLEVSMHQYILDMQELSLASLLKGYFLLP